MTVSGDPASCSQLGGSLRQVAARLRVEERRLRTATDPGEAARPPAPVVRARRRAAQVTDSLAVAVGELDEVGSALQAHASDLAEALSDARQVLDRAAAAGLEHRSGRLVPRWGVAGVADARVATDQDEVRAELQSRLDHVEGLLRRRRTRLAATLRRSTGLLATHAEALRR
ncbi:hypothetical protein GCM10027517_02940 [Phycicoccus ginsengisoli]